MVSSRFNLSHLILVENLLYTIELSFIVSFHDANKRMVLVLMWFNWTVQCINKSNYINNVCVSEHEPGD